MKLIIIDESVENDINLINSFNSDCIIKNSKDYITVNDILNSIEEINTISHLTFIYHYPGFCNLPFYQDSYDVTSTYVYFSNNIIDLINSLKLKDLQYVDILTCNLNYIDFINEVETIKTNENIDIRYSLNQTGNNPNGDWILESDNIDIRNIYFNDNINNWSGILTGSMNTYNLTTFLESGTTFITEENNINGGKTYKLTRNINWSNITHPNYSFVTTNFIQLGTYDIFDGQENTITLSGAINGIFATGSDSTITDVSQRIETASVVKNLGIIGGSANNNTGFVIRQSQNYFKVIRCYSTGTIGNGSGGIAGNQSGLNGVALIQNCYSSGTIASNGGGICGSSAASGGVCLIQNCYSTGSPGYEGGFIVGRDAGTSNGKCILQNCYATGAATSGQTGLAGVAAGHSGFFVFQNCYYPNTVNGSSMTSANAGNNNGNCIIHNSFGKDASGNVNPRFYSSISSTRANFGVAASPPYIYLPTLNTLSELSYGTGASAPKLFENEYGVFHFTDKYNFYVKLKKSGYFVYTSTSYPQLNEFIPTTSISLTNGSLTVNASNGIKPYSYSWSTGANTQSLSNVSYGTYSVTVSDSIGYSNISNYIFEVGGNVPSEPLIYSRPLTLANAVELYWYPPVSDGGNPITSYYLECANISYSNILSSNDKKTIIRNLVTGNSYVFGLTATNAKGNSNIAMYNLVMPGYKPDYPTTLDYTTNLTNYSNLTVTFNNPSFTGNSTLTYNTLTMIPVDVTGNVLSKSSFIHNHSNEGSNIFDPIYYEDFNNNYNYKSYIQSINTVNDSDKNYFSTIMNPSLPTNGLKLWLDPYDLSTLTLSNSKVINWEDKSKNKSNATVNSQYTPTTTGLRMWFDSKDLSTLTITNNKVTQWKDKLNNNLILQPYDIYTGPDYSSNGLVFNNFNNSGRVSGQSGLLLNNNSIYVSQNEKAFFFVYKNLRNTSEGYNDLLQFRQNINFEYHIDLGQTNQGISYKGPYIYTNGNKLYTTVSNWSTINEFTVLGVFFSYDRVHLRVNGTTYTSNITGPVDTRYLTYDTLTLAGHSDNRNFTGTVSEILFYEGLTINDTTTYEKIEGYLAWKWGTQSLLPSNHIFKNYTPYNIINDIIAPTYDSSNALINFNGSQYLNLPLNTLPSGNSAYSIFTYVSTSNISRNNQWFLYSGNPTSNLSLGGFINSNSLVHSWWTNQNISNTNISSNISYLVELTYDSGIRKTFLNGTLVAQDSVSSKNSSTANNLIGTNSMLTGNLVGSIGDIIIYDRILNNLERNSVKNYLERKKYNLSLQNIGNVITWLDASDPNSLFDNANEVKTSYNDFVYNWIDRSYSNNNASQSNIANLPVRRPYIQNNLDVVEFNQSYLTLPTAKYPLDAFIILKLANISDENGVLGIGPSSNNYSSLSDVSGSRWTIDATSNSVVSSTTETSGNFLLMEWSIGNNNNYIRRYGSNVVSSNVGVWTLPNNSNIFIGNANGFDFTKKFKGYIGEIIMFNKQIDDGFRYPIEGYLAWKWGLQSYLSSDHPYKNSPPYLFNRFIRILNNIVTDGLVLYIDSGIAASYPGTGSTFYDLSGNNNHCTLINSPTYSSGNGGKLTFNGSNQYITTPISNIDKPFTLSVWVKFNDLNAFQSFAGQDTSAAIARGRFYFQKAGSTFEDIIQNYSNFSIVISDNSVQSVLSSSTATTNVWYNFTVTISTTQMKFYTNGVLNNTVNNSSSLLPQNSNIILNGAYYNNGVVDIVNGDTSVHLIYNKTLSDAEVLQNYNAFKDRYI